MTAREIIIYAVCGKIGSGKNYYVYEQVRTEFAGSGLDDYQFFQLHRYGNHISMDGRIGLYAFAQELKEDVSRLTGIPYSHFEQRKTKDNAYYGKNGHTPRQLLIKRAEEVRKKSDSFYADKVIKRIIQDKVEIAYITDLRFPVELESLEENFSQINIIAMDSESAQDLII